MRRQFFCIFPPLLFCLTACSSPDLAKNALPRIAATTNTVPPQERFESFDYKPYPREVLVQYDDAEARAKALARKKAKNLHVWHYEISDQYYKDIASAREQIFSSLMPSGIEIIYASAVMPHVTIRLHNKEAYDWLYSSPKITRIWRNEPIKVELY